jgi:hypothetical protein
MLENNMVRQAAADNANISVVGAVAPAIMKSLEQLGAPQDALTSLSRSIQAINNPEVPQQDRAAIASGLIEQFKTVGTIQNMAAEAGAKTEANKLKATEAARKVYIDRAASQFAATGTMPAYVKPEDASDIQVLAAKMVKQGTSVIRDTDPKTGAPIQVTRQVGRPDIVSPVQTLRPSNEEAMQAAFAAKMGGDLASQVSTAVANIPTHVNTIENINMARQAYREGIVTGVGAEVLNNAKSFVNTITGTPMFDLAAPEFLKKSFADFAVDAAARIAKQGQITEGERRLLSDTVAKLGNSAAGNLFIMEFMEGVALREIEKGRYLGELASGGNIKIDSSANFYIKNPLKLPSLTPPEKPNTSEARKIIGK